MARSLAYVEFQKWWKDYAVKYHIDGEWGAAQTSAWYAWVAAIEWAAPRHRTAWDAPRKVRKKAS